MKFQLEPFHRNIPNEVLLDDLRDIGKLLKKNKITESEYDDHGKYSHHTLKRRFGSWFRALEAAGFEKTRNLNINDEELFLNLERVWSTLGRQPRYSEICKPLSKYSAGTYENHFDSWRKALEAFVNYVNMDAPALKDGKPNEKFNPKQNQIPRKNRHISWRLRFLIMRRDGFRCRKCGHSPATEPGVVLHIDHTEAWSKDGPTTYDNLQTLCSVCNIGKSDLDDSE